VHLLVLPPAEEDDGGGSPPAPLSDGSAAPPARAPAGACTAELVVTRLAVMQSLHGGPWVTLPNSADAAPSLARPFYFTVAPNGRIAGTRFAVADDERTVALKKVRASGQAPPGLTNAAARVHTATAPGSHLAPPASSHHEPCAPNPNPTFPPATPCRASSPRSKL
jgi:hypothetical protein